MEQIEKLYAIRLNKKMNKKRKKCQKIYRLQGYKGENKTMNIED